MYQPRLAFRTEFVPVRHWRYHLRIWGEPAPDKTPLVLVHGWMDVSASWQFVVDALADSHFIIAPDWRGFGLTEGPPTDHFWFPDYVADLDFLLDHYAPDRPVDLVGHSMGGHVSMLYAGTRPERIRKLVNIEGFGLAASRPAEAPGRLVRWIDELKALHRGDKDLQAYESVEAVAKRLIRTNPRLSEDKAQWLAGQWARADEDGRWRIRGDPTHKVINAQLYRVEEVLATYGRITAPLLVLEAEDNSLSSWSKGRYTLDEFHKRLSSVAHARVVRVDSAGHMVHHDQPTRVAQLIETFLSDQA